MYEFRNVKGHIEVFLNGEFQFSADTMKEAKDELNADRSYGRIGVKALSQWPTVSPWTSIELFVYESIFRCHLRIGGRKGE